MRSIASHMLPQQIARLIFFVVTIALLTSIARGDAAFDAAFVSFDVGWRPHAAAVGDVDGDGNLDILVTRDASPGAICVLRGSGDGSFARVSEVTTDHGATAIALGDVNHDGRPDAVVMLHQERTVAVLTGNGDATFARSADVPIPDSNPPSWSNPRALALVDMNSDDHLDIVMAAFRITIVLGNGDGSFQSPRSFMGLDAIDLAVGDLNGDTRPDVVVIGAGGSMAMFLGLGNGDVTTHHSIFATNTSATSVALAHFDSDRWLDVAITDASGLVSVWRGVRQWQLSERSDWHTSAGTGSDLAAADVNGDENMDLLVASLNGPVAVLAGRGDATFEPAAHYRAADRSTALAVADFDADGLPDLVVVNQASGTVSIHGGNTDGTFGDIRSAGVGSGPRSLASGDLNGDGVTDFCVGGSPMAVLLGLGDGRFQRVATHYVNVRQLSLVDLDADDALDLIAVSRAGTHVFLGRGDGTFDAPLPVISGNDNSTATDDLDGDGRLDLVTCSSNGARIHRGRGDGAFDLVGHLGGGPITTAVGIADLNGDGHPDVVVTSASPPPPESGSGPTPFTAVYLNDGHGGFAGSIDLAGYAFAIAFDDMNRDGHVDLVLNSDDVAILLGSGDGTFAAPLTFDAAGDEGGSIATADLDQDGAADVVLSSPTTSAVSVLFGRGDGTLHPKRDFGTGGRPYSASVADVDASGGPDIAVANFSLSSLGVLLNRMDRLTPITVSDLAATTIDGGVHLAWTLAGSVQHDLRDLIVQRAGQQPGPYVHLASFRLVRDTSMEFVDHDVEWGQTYWYRLLVVTHQGEHRIVGPVSVQYLGASRLDTSLSAPIVGPTGETVQLRYSIGRPRTRARLGIYDVRGRLLRSFDLGVRDPGNYLIEWNRTDHNGQLTGRGVYVVQLRAAQVSASKKLVLAR